MRQALEGVAARVAELYLLSRGKHELRRQAAVENAGERAIQGEAGFVAPQHRAHDGTCRRRSAEHVSQQECLVDGVRDNRRAREREHPHQLRTDVCTVCQLCHEQARRAIQRRVAPDAATNQAAAQRNRRHSHQILLARATREFRQQAIQQLVNYGLDTGLAFQIQDDLLNLIGSEESVKKDFRSDITEGKRTLSVVHALEHSDQAARLEEILSSKTRDPKLLAEAVDIMQESGSIDYARSYAQNLTSIAKNHLLSLVRPSNARDMLESMADWFVHRLS